jgi:hypothetical protein
MNVQCSCGSVHCYTNHWIDVSDGCEVISSAGMGEHIYRMCMSICTGCGVKPNYTVLHVKSDWHLLAKCNCPI